MAQIDHIDITDNGNTKIRTISDSSKIKRIVAFVIAHDTGWETPWAGTPVARIQVNFYAGKELIDSLGVGSNFLTAQGCGAFQSRGVSSKDRKSIMALLALDDPAVGN